MRTPTQGDPPYAGGVDHLSQGAHQLYGCLVSSTPIATTNNAKQQLDYGLQLSKHEAIPLRAARAALARSAGVAQPLGFWVQLEPLRAPGRHRQDRLIDSQQLRMIIIISFEYGYHFALKPSCRSIIFQDA